jgi:hypothetical protein
VINRLSAHCSILPGHYEIISLCALSKSRGECPGSDQPSRIRVQMNTAEQFVMFLLLLWLATIYPVVSGYLAPLLGLIWLIGRMSYARGYMADAAKRSLGFLICGVAILGLLALAFIGIIRAWLVTRPV